MAERWRVYMRAFEGASEDAAMKYLGELFPEGESMSVALDQGIVLLQGEVLDTPPSTG